MPTTAARLKYLPRAIRCFKEQTHPSMELVIIEDGGAGVRESIPPDPRIRYVSVPKCGSIGQKRNIAATMAAGQYIAHWDDDDWSAPERIAVQVAELQRVGAAVTGFQRLLFWDERSGEAKLYAGSSHYSPGSTLLYRRDFWAANQFAPLQVGEDNIFIGQAARQHQLAVLDGYGLMVATTHGGNTSPRDSHATRSWKPAQKFDIPAGYFTL
jgi:glycosyltransferase involved in cell wall biosynthesis